MTAHTPGPWKASYRKDLQSHEIRGDGTPLAEVSDSWQSGQANAQLVAAAPEMLKALKRLEANTKHRQGDCYSDDYMGVCICGKEEARAAIAKAEGRVS